MSLDDRPDALVIRIYCSDNEVVPALERTLRCNSRVWRDMLDSSDVPLLRSLRLTETSVVIGWLIRFLSEGDPNASQILSTTEPRSLRSLPLEEVMLHFETASKYQVGAAIVAIGQELFKRMTLAPYIWRQVHDAAARAGNAELVRYTNWIGAQEEAKKRQARLQSTWTRLMIRKRRLQVLAIFFVCIGVPLSVVEAVLTLFTMIKDRNTAPKSESGVNISILLSFGAAAVTIGRILTPLIQEFDSKIVKTILIPFEYLGERFFKYEHPYVTSRSGMEYFPILHPFTTGIYFVAFLLNLSYTFTWHVGSDGCRTTPSHAECKLAPYTLSILLLSSLNSVAALFSWTLLPVILREFDGRDLLGIRKSVKRMPQPYTHLQLSTNFPAVDQVV